MRMLIKEKYGLSYLICSILCAKNLSFVPKNFFYPYLMDLKALEVGAN